MDFDYINCNTGMNSQTNTDMSDSESDSESEDCESMFQRQQILTRFGMRSNGYESSIGR